MKFHKLLLLSALAAIAAVSVLHGQFTSQIEGTVMDPSRAVVPGATLTLENTETGIRTTVQTNEAGYYRFPSLPAGRFRLTVNAQGFKPIEISDLQLSVGQTRTVNLSLELGAAATAVSVTAEAAAVELSVARVSQVIEQKQLTELPLPGRNFLGLVALAPGVVGSTGQNDVFGSEPQIQMSAAGLRGEQNGFSVDAASVTSMVRRGRINLQPNAESIQEMRVAVNDFSAEKGNDAGATVNVLTKQGTNEFHGSLAWFHSNNKFQSRSLFQNVPNALTGRVLPVTRKNEYMGSIGGPVIKNRTFFFGSFDVMRQVTASNAATQVETSEFRSFVKQRFPSNKSAFLLDKYPAAFEPYTNFLTVANILGVPCSGSAQVTTPIGMMPCDLRVVGQGVTPITSPRQGEQWNVRGDHMITGKDRFYVNVFRNSEGSMDGSTIRPAFRIFFPIRNWYGSINETHTFSPNLINEFRATAVRVHGEIECAECQIPSGISIAGTGGISGFGKGGPVPFIQNNYHYSDTISWIRGTHTIRGGFTLSKLQSNWKPTASYQRPSYSFNNIWDFVLDDPFSQGNIGLNPVDGSVYTPDVAERQTTVGWFFEDSWKLRSNLTMTYGVRWETYGKVGQATLGNNVRWRSGNDFTSRIADGKNETRYNILENGDYNNFAPRLSFAWDPTSKGKMSIRSGAGIFYDQLPSQLYGGAHYTPPIYMIITASKQTAPLLPRYDFCRSSTNPYQCARPLGLEGVIGLDERNGSTFARANIAWIDPNLKSSYVMSYFFGIQYALDPNTTVEVNYIGNLGRKLYAKYNVNRYRGDLIQNNGVLRRLNPSFGAIDYAQSNFTSAYNGGTVSVNRRMSLGLMFQTAYTFGRAIDYASGFGGGLPIIDIFDLKLNRGLSDFQRTHKLAFSAVWQIPAPVENRWLKGAVGGWQFSTAGILQSGGPFTVNCTDVFRPVRTGGVITGNTGCDWNADGTTNDRPMAPSFPKIRDTSKQAYLTGVFARADFPSPGLGLNGSLGRNTYFNPGLISIDMAMMKNFALKERTNLQFRAEAFNAPNRVNLGGVTSNMNSSNFGRVTSAGDARRFQLGLRFTF